MLKTKQSNWKEYINCNGYINTKYKEEFIFGYSVLTNRLTIYLPFYVSSKKLKYIDVGVIK